MSYIQVTELSKEYKVGQNTIKALDKVSFEINEGEFVVILGSSGAGKSTLLNILGGMDLATSGMYKIADDEITSYNLKKLQKYRRNDIGFVFQFYNLIPNLTAYENVLIAEVENGYKAKDVLDMVGLSERLNNFPKALSGGEQQRVSIARAVVKKPKLLLCDEPTGALDSKTGAQIIELLCNMARKEGKTVIVVTHNQALANICDRLIRIKDGKIIENPRRLLMFGRLRLEMQNRRARFFRQGRLQAIPKIFDKTVILRPFADMDNVQLPELPSRIPVPDMPLQTGFFRMQQIAALHFFHAVTGYDRRHGRKTFRHIRPVCIYMHVDIPFIEDQPRPHGTHKAHLGPDALPRALYIQYFQHMPGFFSPLRRQGKHIHIFLQKHFQPDRAALCRRLAFHLSQR